MNTHLQHKRIRLTITMGLLILLFGIVSGCQNHKYGGQPQKARLQESPGLKDVTLKMTDLADKPAKLVNGRYEGDHLSVRVLRTSTADFNRDGLIDGVLIVWVNSGGSGNFRTLCLMLNNGKVLVQTDEAFIGDRIKITSLKINTNTITVEYLDRGPEDAYSVEPYIKKKVQYRVQGMKMKLLPAGQR